MPLDKEEQEVDEDVVKIKEEPDPDDDNTIEDIALSRIDTVLQMYGIDVVLRQRYGKMMVKVKKVLDKMSKDVAKEIYESNGLL